MIASINDYVDTVMNLYELYHTDIKPKDNYGRIISF